VEKAIANNEFPELMTEGELVDFLRIPLVSKSKHYGNVVDNLKRMRGLPCLHICHQPLYLRQSVIEWVKSELERESR
jgi:hypothetical protein